MNNRELLPRGRYVAVAALALWGLAAFSAARLVMALTTAALTGGAFSMSATGINAAGGTASGGGTVVAFSMGANATAMSGGAFTMTPGPIGGVNTARATLNEAHAFPTPFRPDLGHDRITFTKLSAKATINIYTLSGRRVRSLTKDEAGSDTLVWKPVVNEEGGPLASGVYLFVVSDQSLNPKRGKLMIIK